MCYRLIISVSCKQTLKVCFVNGYYTLVNILFFVLGDNYYRYSDEKDGVDPGYPRKIRDGWPGTLLSMPVLSNFTVSSQCIITNQLLCSY